MPKRKQRTGSFFTSSKRSRVYKKNGYNTAAKALTMAKQVKAMVNKTLENKQINAAIQNVDVPMGGYALSGFLGITQGPADGSAIGSNARIGKVLHK